VAEFEKWCSKHFVACVLFKWWDGCWALCTLSALKWSWEVNHKQCTVVTKEDNIKHSRVEYGIRTSVR